MVMLLARVGAWLSLRPGCANDCRAVVQVTAAPILVSGLFSLAASVSERPVARLHLGHACCLPV